MMMMQKWRWPHGSVGILTMSIVSSIGRCQQEALIYMPSLMPFHAAHLSYNPSLIHPQSLCPLKHLHLYYLPWIASGRSSSLKWIKSPRPRKRLLCQDVSAQVLLPFGHMSVFSLTTLYATSPVFPSLFCRLPVFLPNLLIISTTGTNARPDRHVMDLCSQHATVPRHKAIAGHQKAV